MSFFLADFFRPVRARVEHDLPIFAHIHATLIFYEAPHRIAATLQDAHEVLGERKRSSLRELTKMHEEIARGRLSELAARFSVENARGEMVLIIDRAVIEGETKRLKPRVSASGCYAGE